MKTLSFPKGPALREVVENIATAEGGALVPLGPSLADDAAAIRAAHDAFEAGTIRAADAALAAGRRLIELKARVRRECGPGLWEEYLAETFPFSVRTAQNYMRAAKRNQGLGAETNDLSFLRKARAAKVIGGIGKK